MGLSRNKVTVGEPAVGLPPLNIAENIELGYLLGLTKGEDGKWYTDKECTEPAKGVMSVLAGIDVGDVLAAIQEGDPLEIVQSLIGNASVRSIYETIDPDGDVPAIVEALGDLNVKDLLRDGAENIVPNLIENLNY